MRARRVPAAGLGGAAGAARGHDIDRAVGVGVATVAEQDHDVPEWALPGTVTISPCGRVGCSAPWATCCDRALRSVREGDDHPAREASARDQQRAARGHLTRVRAAAADAGTQAALVIRTLVTWALAVWRALRCLTGAATAGAGRRRARSPRGAARARLRGPTGRHGQAAQRRCGRLGLRKRTPIAFSCLLSSRNLSRAGKAATDLSAL